MKRYDPKNIRNVAFVGHSGCGKTSLGEAALFGAGASNRLGRVDDGTSLLDWEPEENSRKSSVSTGLGSCEWQGTKLNIMDTPGDANFKSDARNCLSVADAGLLVVSAVGGVEVGTEASWGYLEEFSLPRVIVINKVERERANPEGTLSEIKEVLSAGVAPLQVLIGKESTFEGLVDLVTGKAYRYSGDKKGSVGEVPANLSDAVAEARRVLVEAVAESDEALMDKYFEEDDLSPEDLRTNLPKLIASGALVPLVYTCATKMMGVDLLLDLMKSALPSPLDRPPEPAKNGASGESVEVTRSDVGPFAAQVFKTVADPYAGKLTLFRIFRGSLDSDGNFFNATQDLKERYGQILSIQGKKQVAMPSAGCGDIVAVAKLKETKTGDSLCDPKGPVVFAPPSAIRPIISFAVKPKAKGEEDKVIHSLQRLAEEDPSLELTLDEQSRDIILSGMGQVHVEVVLARLKRKFGVEVELKLPKVPYRETITRKVTNVEGKHKKQSGGRGQFGVVYVDMEPLPRGEQYEFDNAIFGGSVPRQYIPAVDKGIQEAMVKGPLIGRPVVDIKVRLFDGKYHNVDSSEMAFKIAGSLAFKAAFMAASPCLLEPVMNMEIIVPDDSMGDVMGDITSRRGKVQGMDARGRNQVIRAQIPMAEVLQYAPGLHSMTSGRGTFSMELSHFDPVPSHLFDKVLATVQADAEASD